VRATGNAWRTIQETKLGVATISWKVLRLLAAET